MTALTADFTTMALLQALVGLNATKPLEGRILDMTIAATPWNAQIQYGPEGEANYAWVYADDGEMIGTFRTHHADRIVTAVNAFEANQARIAELEKALKTAHSTIHAWHGPTAWDIYDRASPEMKVINAALSGAKP